MFWYARPGAGDDTPPDPLAAAQLVTRERRDLVPPVLVEGALEAERFEVLSVDAGTAEVQTAYRFRWSDDRQLWWHGGRLGDVLELGFDAPRVAPGGQKRAIAAELTQAIDYGIVALSINGVPAAVPFDGFHDGVVHRRVDLGRFPLHPSGNLLRVELVGSNPEAVPKHMFGLDYLLVED